MNWNDRRWGKRGRVGHHDLLIDCSRKKILHFFLFSGTPCCSSTTSATTTQLQPDFKKIEKIQNTSPAALSTESQATLVPLVPLCELADLGVSPPPIVGKTRRRHEKLTARGVVNPYGQPDRKISVFTASLTLCQGFLTQKGCQVNWLSLRKLYFNCFSSSVIRSLSS